MPKNLTEILRMLRKHGLLNETKVRQYLKEGKKYVLQSKETKKYLKDVSALDSHLAKATGNFGISTQWTKDINQAKKYSDYNTAFDFIAERRSNKYEIIEIE